MADDDDNADDSISSTGEDSPTDPTQSSPVSGFNSDTAPGAREAMAAHAEVRTGSNSSLAENFSHTPPLSDSSGQAPSKPEPDRDKSSNVNLTGVRATARAGQVGAKLGDATADIQGRVEEPSGSDVSPEAVAAAPAPYVATGPTSARLARDSASTVDELGFSSYASAIARFLTHPDSVAPLTISIQAPWGGGKTSLMRMIQEVLDPEVAERDARKEEVVADGAPVHQPRRRVWWHTARVLVRAANSCFRAVARELRPSDTTTTGRLSVRGARIELERLQTDTVAELPAIPTSTSPEKATAKQRVTVWFNAWKYESTNQVWAGLVDAILQQVPARLSMKERERFWFILNTSRVEIDRVRQRLLERTIDLALRSTVGLVPAIVATAVLVASVLGLSHVLGVLPLFKSVFGWLGPTGKPIGESGTALTIAGAFALVKWFAAKLHVEAEPAGEVVKNLVDVPKYEQELGFVHQVAFDLKRVFRSLPPGEGLVIFIDDLDRCTPSKVAAVLEAVNLFLAGEFPSCCFVIGMDTEMVAAALQVAHKDLTANLPAGEITPLGWRFMDKFVQLPFVIPPVDSRNYERLMMRLLGRDIEAADPSAGKLEGDKPAGPESLDNEAERLDALIDTPEFIALTKHAAQLLGTNPRELKRFVNLLRFNYFLLISRQRQGLQCPPAAALARWTALSVKWPEHARWLRRVRERGVPDKDIGDLLSDETEQTRSHQQPNNLLLLERLATKCKEPGGEGYKAWHEKLVAIYQLQGKEPSWIGDESLLDFYADPSAQEYTDESLSSNQNTGFW